MPFVRSIIIGLLFMLLGIFYCNPGNNEVILVIKDNKGKSLPSATVAVGRYSAQSDKSGQVHIKLIPDNEYVISVIMNGYAPTARKIQIANGQTIYLEILLNPLQKIRIESPQNGENIANERLILKIPKNSLRDSNGKIATEADVEYSVPDLSGEGLSLMPGDFYGISKHEKGEPVLLETAGIFYIRFTSQGKILQPSEPVVIAIPQQGNLKIKNIPLWRFDPESALWIEEGVAELIQHKKKKWLQASLSHFSWWNCDAPIKEKTSIWIKSFVDSSGNPLEVNSLTGYGVDYSGISSISGSKSNAINAHGPGKCIDVKINSSVQINAKSLSNGFHEYKEVILSKNISTSCNTNPEKGLVIDKIVLKSLSAACVMGSYKLDSSPNSDLPFSIGVIGWEPSETYVFEASKLSSLSEGEFCFDKVPLDFTLQIRISETSLLTTDYLKSGYLRDTGKRVCHPYSAFSLKIPKENKGNCGEKKNLCLNIGELKGGYSCH